MDIDKAINVVNQYLTGFIRPDSDEFNEALHVLLSVAYTVTQPHMNDILNDENFNKPVKVHFDYNAVTCERCKKVITDGRIIRKTDDPTKGICFDCC